MLASEAVIRRWPVGTTDISKAFLQGVTYEELSQLTIERKRAADAAKEAKRAKKKGGLPLLDLDGVKGSGSSDGDSSSMFILRGGTSTATSGSTDDDSSSAFVLR